MLAREISLERRKGRTSEAGDARCQAFVVAHCIEREVAAEAHYLSPETIAKRGRVKGVGDVVLEGVTTTQSVGDQVPLPLDMRRKNMELTLDFEQLDVAGKASKELGAAPSFVGVGHSDGVIRLDNDCALRKEMAPFRNGTPNGIQFLPVDVVGKLAGRPGAADPAVLPRGAPAGAA